MINLKASYLNWIFGETLKDGKNYPQLINYYPGPLEHKKASPVRERLSYDLINVLLTQYPGKN